MNKNLLKLIAVCGTACFLACTAPQKAETEKWSERMARSEMQRFPEPWMIEKAKKPRWGYTHGLVVKSMLEEWKHTGDSTYYEYAKIYADSLIDADGHIKTMKYSFRSLRTDRRRTLQNSHGYFAQANGRATPYQ